MLSLKAEVASLAVRQQSVKLSTEGRSHSEGVSPLGGTGPEDRQLGEAPSAACCRWTPDGSCGPDVTQHCTFMHEYLEAKTTTHEFAAVTTCFGNDDTSKYRASFNGLTSNVSLAYDGSVVTQVKTPLKVTHAANCASHPPTMTVQLDTVFAGGVTAGGFDIPAEIASIKAEIASMGEHNRRTQ